MKKQKRYKQIATGVILLVALIFGLSRIDFKSVDSYQKEQEQISRDLGLGGDSDKALINDSISDEKMENTEETEFSDTKEEEGQENKGKEEKNPKEKRQKEDSADEDRSENKKNESQKEKNSSKKGSNSSKKGSSGKKIKDNPSGSQEKEDSSQTDTGSEAQPPESGEGNSTIPVAVSTPTPQVEESVAPAATKEPQKAKITCKVQIVCHTLVENKEGVDSGVLKYIPSNGVLLTETTITVEEGTTAYEALSQICKANSIALDAEYTPMYKNYYVKGIGHLYEKQAGDRSGWVYKINGKAPNKGASSFVLSEGDTMTWAYTCDGKTS